MRAYRIVLHYMTEDVEVLWTSLAECRGAKRSDPPSNI